MIFDISNDLWIYYIAINCKICSLLRKSSKYFSFLYCHKIGHNLLPFCNIHNKDKEYYQLIDTAINEEYEFGTTNIDISDYINEYDIITYLKKNDQNKKFLEKNIYSYFTSIFKKNWYLVIIPKNEYNKKIVPKCCCRSTDLTLWTSDNNKGYKEYLKNKLIPIVNCNRCYTRYLRCKNCLTFCEYCEENYVCQRCITDEEELGNGEKAICGNCIDKLLNKKNKKISEYVYTNDTIDKEHDRFTFLIKYNDNIHNHWLATHHDLQFLTNFVIQCELCNIESYDLFTGWLHCYHCNIHFCYNCLVELTNQMKYKPKLYSKKAYNLIYVNERENNWKENLNL